MTSHTTATIFAAAFTLAGLVSACSPHPKTTTPPTSTNSEQRACTRDAKVCPDGSAVGRSGPNCEFAACPDIAAEPTPPAEPTPTP